jgi:hypothetical protein
LQISPYHLSVSPFQAAAPRASHERASSHPPFPATARPLHLACAACLLPSNPSAFVVRAPFVAAPLTGSRLLPVPARVGAGLKIGFPSLDSSRQRHCGRRWPLLAAPQASPSLVSRVTAGAAGRRRPLPRATRVLALTCAARASPCLILPTTWRDTPAVTSGYLTDVTARATTSIDANLPWPS